MPTFEFSAPDGQTYHVDGPDGATPEQAFAVLQSQIGANPTKEGAQAKAQLDTDQQPAMSAGDPLAAVPPDQSAPSTGSVFDNQDAGGPRMDAPTNDALVNERALDNARKSNPAIDKSPMYATGLANEKARALVDKGAVAQDKAEAIRTKSSGSTAQDMALNLLGGLGGTVNKAGATVSQAVGAEDAEAAFDSAAETYKKMQADNGGGMVPGKVAGFVGAVAPAALLAAVLPATEAFTLVTNAGLFALPAFRDTLKEKLEQGQDFPLALAHASQSFGLNLFLPTFASKGGALVNSAAGKGVIGSAASAAAEGAGFSAATTVLDKGTDLVAGEKNQKDWLDFSDMGTMALGFGAMRGIHAGAGVAQAAGSAVMDRVGSPSQQFGRAFGQDVDAARYARTPEQALAAVVNVNPNLRDVVPKTADPVADIFKAGSVQDAAAAAERAAGLTPQDSDLTPGDKIRRARPLRPVEPEAQPEGTPDVSADGELPRVADGAGGERGDLAASGVDADLGAGSAGEPAMVGGGDARQAEAVAAPVADGLGADAVAPRVEPFATKPEANMAGLKEGAVAVPVEGGYALQLNTRPYSDRERTAAQMDVDRLNRGLAAHAPDMEPARLLSTAPSPEMAVGRRIGRLMGVKVVFIEDHPDFRGVAESGVAYVSPQTKYPAIAIVGHEVFHAFVDQHPQEGEALKEQVRQYLNQDRVNERLSGVRGDRGRAEEEAFADLHGAMWMDPKFWAEMRRNDPNSFRKLAYAFMQAISHATQHMGRFKAEDFVSDVDTVRKIIAREMSTLAREEGVGKHNPVEAEELGIAKGVTSDKAAERNPLKDWLSGLGIDPALKREFAPGLTEQRSAMGRGGSMFRQGGLNLDALAEQAWQDGYLPRPDAHAMYDLMARAFGGERVAPTFGEGQAEAEMQRRVEQAQQANEDAARDWSLAPDEVEATGFGAADPDVQAQVRRLVAQAEAHNIDGEGILETLARRNPNATTDEYLAAARDALQAAVPPEGEAGARDHSADSRGQGAQEGAGLESYSEGDLRTRAAREEAVTRADKAATAEADRRASAESPNSFRLTGSDRSADEAAARGQTPMFSGKDASPLARIAESLRRFPMADPKGMPLTEFAKYARERRLAREALATELQGHADGLLVPVKGGMFWGISRDTRPDGIGWRVTRFDHDMTPIGHHVYESPREAVLDVIGHADPERLAGQPKFARKPGKVTREQARQMGDLRKKAQTLQELQAQGGDVYKAQLSRADRAVILESVRQLRAEGVPAGEARKQAVERLLEDTHAAIEKMRPSEPAFSRKEDKPFYSALARGIEGINAKSQPAEGWRAQIQGLVNKGAVKADEVEWSGLNDWLKMKSGKVSKQEVQDFIAANGVQVHEVTKESNPVARVQKDYTEAMMRHGATEAEAERMFNAMLAFSRDQQHNEEQKDKGFALVMKDGAFTGNEIHDATSNHGGPKYGQYTLPGGSNYRELLLTLPDKKEASRQSVADRFNALRDKVRESRPDQVYQNLYTMRDRGELSPEELAELKDIDHAVDSDKGPDPYKSSHWDEKNILAHIRLNDRTDADGKKTLFVEELQSDWAQQGRKQGFRDPVRAAELRAQAEALKSKLDVTTEEGRAAFAERQRLRMEADRLEDAPTPRAPFVDSTDKWLPLALKRIIKLAADEGYDKVAFVNGEQSAERYDLSKKISRVEFQDNHTLGVGKADLEGPASRGILHAYDLDGRRVIDRPVDDAERELPDLIGKEAAQKLLNQPGRSERTGGGTESRVKELKGLDLKVGGEGMKSFYDAVVPQALSKLLPKFGGAKMEQVQVDRTTFGKNGKPADWNPRDGAFSDQPGFSVTDAMREKTAGGVPMFSRKDKPEEPAKPATPNPSHGFHTREIQVDGQWRPIEDSTGRLIARGDFRSQQNFYRFFGDSKAVDDKGRPLVLYHGTIKDVSRFDTNVERNMAAFRDAQGFYFTNDPRDATAYTEGKDGDPRDGANVMPVYLRITNPLRVAVGDMDNHPAYVSAQRRAKLEAQGYDGIIYADGVEFVVFKPEQIKSALGNVGTFDGTNPDIRFSRDSVSAGKPSMHEGGPDRRAGDSEAITNLLKSESFRLHGLGGLDVPSQREVIHGVLALGQDLKVLKSVVGLVPVDVMNVLRREERSPERRRYDEAVLRKLLSVDHDGSVASAVDVANALVRAVAAVRAEWPDHPVGIFAGTKEGVTASNAGEREHLVSTGHDGEYTGNGGTADIRFARKGTTAATANLPASAPLGTWERSKSVVSDLIDEGLTRSGVYRFTSPMSEGSVRAKAIAQNFANAERQARAEWQRIQDVIAKDFPDKTVREKMWNAADQENEILSGRLAPGPTVGLASLTPRQRDVVEQLHAYGEELLQRAKDVGMFSGDGVPYWTPRMMVMLDANGDYVKPTEPGKKQTSGGDGRNVFTSSSNLKQRKYLTAADTEAAMNAKGGEMVRDITTMPMAMQRLERAVAGRELINQIKDLGKATGTPTVSGSMHDGFFTLDHPAFTTYQPRFEKDPATGKSVVQKDAHGDPILDRVPLYMSKEFEGPIKAILSNADGTLYRGYMLLKSKAMSAIMFSPLIHNMVIFGRALGYDPTLVGTAGLYLRGNAAKKDEALVRTAIDAGLVPMGGNHAGMIDVTDIARGIGREGGLGDPNESWIAHGAKAIIGAVNKDAGAAAKRFVDKAGDIWHGTLLWDRVGDLQMGIFAHAYDRLQSEGFDPKVAAVMAAHWGNRYAGAVGRENMGEYARKAANVLLFSRSFNAGNLGTIKDMLYGLPAGLRAKIEYEHGKAAASQAFTEARRKAVGGFIADAALSLIALSIAQSAVDKLKKDKGWDEIFGGYMDRAQRMAGEIKRHPMTPKSYSPWQLSPTHDNEPGKQDRVDMGEIPGAGGRHEYMRLPTGKVVEDLVNWTMHPAETFSSKMSPLAKAAWQIVSNDKGFGVPVYDPDGSMAGFGVDVAKHLAKAQTPWDTIVTAWDKMQGRTTPIENAKLLGNMTGFSASQGHPQGPEAGVAAQVEERVKAQKLMAMEEVKRLLRYDKEDQAREKLEAVGLTPREVSQVIKKIENPKEMTPAQRRRFNQHGNEEDQQRMERVTR